MPRIIYLDEAGDHSLEKEDKDFPVFALVMMVCDQEAYENKLVPMVNRLKFDYFGHECVIIHSRDIRKAQGDFGFPLIQLSDNRFTNGLMRLCRSLATI